MNSSIARVIGIRFLVIMAASLLIGLLISEGAYRLQSDSGVQPAKEVRLVIPPGTSQRIAAGEVVTSLPSSMTFVEGDTILVENQDVVDHQLGPIWVPPGTSGSMVLDRPQKYSVACSFQPGSQLNLDVLPRVQNVDRLQGLLSVGLPTGVLAWLFSLVLVPVKGMD